MSELHKMCADCKITKPLDDFYTVKKRKDGKCCYCKKCRIKISAKWKAGRQRTLKEGSLITTNKVKLVKPLKAIEAQLIANIEKRSANAKEKLSIKNGSYTKQVAASKSTMKPCKPNRLGILVHLI